MLAIAWGTRWRSWLGHCATSRKITGSISVGVTGIFHWHNPSGRTMTLGSTQPLTKMSTKYISCEVKEASAYGWQLYHLHVPTVFKSGSLNLLGPSGPVQAFNGIALPYQQSLNGKRNDISTRTCSTYTCTDHPFITSDKMNLSRFKYQHTYSCRIFKIRLPYETKVHSRDRYVSAIRIP
jgi:hypothetical protein